VAAGATAAVLVAAHGNEPTELVVRTTLPTRTIVERTTTHSVHRAVHARRRRRPAAKPVVRTVSLTVAAAPAPRRPTTTTVPHTTPKPPPTTTRAAPTTTAPRKEAAPPVKPSPKPKRVSRSIADAFDGTALAAATWSRFASGSGWTMGVSGGQLAFDFSGQTQADATDGTYGGHVETVCSFPGDFDARVDYDLAAWPPGTGVRVLLSAFLGPSPTGWTAERDAGTYASYADGRLRSVAATDTSGTLRVARHGGVFTSSYRQGGRWTVLATAQQSGVASIGIGAVGSGAFGDQPVSVAFDNFRVTGVNALCP
jgi:hypothetical protein